MRRTFAPALAITLAIATLAAPRLAAATPPDATPAVEGKPFVPRYQGPWQPTAFNPGQEIWGFALVGAGAFIGGLGLYALERPGEAPCAAPCADSMSESAELGTALLISGIFISGLGLYLVVTTDAPPRVVVDRSTLPADTPALSLALSPFPDGALVRSTLEF